MRLVPGLLALLLAAPCAAEFVVFEDGRALKVTAYRFEGEETLVELPGGGRMRFASAAVRYVAPDEDVLDAPAPSGPEGVLAATGGWEAFADPRFIEPITRIARRHQVDPALVAAMIKVESDFRPHAVSPKGAKGLMQLMPATAAELGVADPFDAEANIEGGVAYIRQLLGRFQGDARLALAAYNAGARAVERARGVPAYAETRAYVERVFALLTPRSL